MSNAASVPNEYFDAIALHKNGKTTEAIDTLVSALKLAPTNIRMHHAVSSMCYHVKDFDLFFTHMEQCIRLAADKSQHITNYLHVANETGRNGDALKLFKSLFTDFPQDLQILSVTAQLAANTGDFETAATVYETLYEINPGDVKTATQLGYSYSKGGDYPKARQFFTDHLETHPKHLSVLVNAAVLFSQHGDFGDAEHYYEKAVEIVDNDPTILNNYANTLRAHQKLNKSIEIGNKIISLYPENAEAHCNNGFCHLALGELKEGWREYEWRWKAESFVHGKMNIALWQGGSLRSKKLMLICEQGYGDAIQFIRYAIDLRKKCKSLHLVCPKPLAGLFDAMGLFSEVAERAVDLQPCDYYITLMSIPQHLKVDRIEDIQPIGPYLDTDHGLDPELQNRLDATPKPKIGLCWRGNPSHLSDAFRSIAFDTFQSLMDETDYQFVSLQFNRDTEAEPLGEQVIDAAPYISDFSDSAQICKQLDLVISVDTSIVHLCGALGTPAWVMISSHHDWRWFKDRDDSPWYSSVKIIRNDAPMNWDRQIQRVKNDLVTYLRDTARK